MLQLLMFSAPAAGNDGETQMQLGSDMLPMALAWYVVFIISTTVHEAAHAFAALKLGDPTAYHGGQVTLDPLPHIRREPFGMVIIPLLSFALSGWMFGWASTPYDPIWAYHNPKKSAIMALAGPTGNLVLVLIAAGLIHLGIFTGFFAMPDGINFSSIVAPASSGIANGAAILVSILFSLNLLLFVFNLIPLPPLDGRAIMEFFLKGQVLEKYRTIMSNPSMRMFGLFIAWTVFDYIFSPILTLSLNLLYPGAEYR